MFGILSKRHSSLVCSATLAAAAFATSETRDLIPAGADKTGTFIHVYDSRPDELGNLVAGVQPFDSSFRGGVRVAAGDVTGDGTADIIVGGDVGSGPRVRVFDGTSNTGSPILDFFAFDPSFRGGVRVAAGDLDGDGVAEIVTGAGPGGGPHVRTFAGNTMLSSFSAFDEGFRGGVFVSAGDVNGDGHADVIAGMGPGGSPQVKVFNGDGSVTLANFFAYEPNFKGGVRVGVADPFGYRALATGRSTMPPYYILTAPGQKGKLEAKFFKLKNNAVSERLFGGFGPFGDNWSKGVFVAP